MLIRLALVFPVFLFASMLTEAESIGKKYALAIAKQPPPSLLPRTNALLDMTSSWLIVNLNTLQSKPGQTVLETLSDKSLWQILQEIGFDGIHVKNLKEGGRARTSFRIDPNWGEGWIRVQSMAESYGISLVGDLVGTLSGIGADFELALQNIADYAQLYRLIEIDPKDWKLLPKIPVGANLANIPWLTLEELYNKGYIPEATRPYTKESSWNASRKIICADGVERRWIYLKEGENFPLFSWLSPSFATNRIASADALDWVYHLKAKILRLDAQVPSFAKETTALWTRKIGGFTIASTRGTFAEVQTAPTDLVLDSPTQPAFLHALLTGDARVLRLIYLYYSQQGVAINHLLHALEPFESSPCEWTEFLQNPKKKYQYGEEKITAELLRDKLLKEDLLRLQGESQDHLPVSTWGGYCAMAFSNEEIEKAHLLLAFGYAMQPGVFALSAEDLIGQIGNVAPPLSLSSPNPGALYPSLPGQMKTPRSFATHLKKILAVRKSSKIAAGELIAVPQALQKGTLLLLHRLPESRFYHLLALNFSRSPVQEKIQFPSIQDTWAIDLMTGMTAEKGFEAGVFFFDLPPLSGKVFLFQPKYYD